MYRYLMLCLVLVSIVGLVACNTMGESKEQIGQKVERAGQSREELWVNLQMDKELFSEAEWEQLELAHGRAIELAADIEVGLLSPGGLSADLVEEWVAVGGALYTGVEGLLEPRLRSLSPATKAAWAVEKARLRGLQRTGEAYLANPNAETYREVAKMGLNVLGFIL